ncbi:MAG TPA: DUF6152 family protein [Vicinamibacterales bacterium]|nr:DUF6152 family protein [Vicinamibacterales bacterium]
MIRRSTFAALLLAAATPALAHHGFGTFEMQKTVSYTKAKLTRVEFLNPHGWLYFETTENGKVMKHRCELRSAHVLRRSGWSPELFKSGEIVDITASPDRADVASCYLQTIVFANGSRMDRYGQYVKAGGSVKEVRGQANAVNTLNRPARRPSGEPNISGDWAPEQVVMRDPRGVGGSLQRLSTIGERPDDAPAQARAGGAAAPAAGRGGAAAGGGRGRGAAGPRMFNGAELTERAIKEADAMTQADNPRFKCQTTSIIFDWTFDGPVNRITQNRDTIVIEYGQMNLKRTVYMNMKQRPANIKPTRAGHSIGRWDGDTLVVDTVGFLPGVLNGNTRHGDKLHVVERFTLDPKTWQLSRTWEAEDPDYLKSKASSTTEVPVMPADAPYAKDECKEQKDVDYSKEQAQRR